MPETDESLLYNTCYYLWVSTGVQDAAGNSLASVYGSSTTTNFMTEAESAGNLRVDNVVMNEDKRYATAGGDFEKGWEWIISLTVPTNEPNVKLKFSDFAGWASGAGIDANNIRYFSSQATNYNSAASPVSISGANTYPAQAMIFNSASDTVAGSPGIQIAVTVQVRVPSGTPGGAYSAQFQVTSLD